MGKKRPRCLSCKNYFTVWGRTSYGKKRYGCNTCGKTRVYHRLKKKTDFFALFRQYVFWGHTYEQLADQSGYSIQYLSIQFHLFIKQSPPKLPPFRQVSGFLLIDGLWLKRGFVLMAYRQSKSLLLLHISVVGSEVGTKIAKDLIILKIHYHFTGIVSDGGTGISKAVGEIFPHIPHQICLAHLHRDIIAAIGKYPKRTNMQELKALADHIWLIESKEALKWWKGKVQQWMKRNTDFLKERRYDLEYNSWYVHKGARRTVAILKELPQTSFHFLDFPLMPKTTNELEAQFGHLGNRWLAHRGLKTETWKYFMDWFVYFYNKNKLS